MNETHLIPTFSKGEGAIKVLSFGEDLGEVRAGEVRAGEVRASEVRTGEMRIANHQTSEQCVPNHPNQTNHKNHSSDIKLFTPSKADRT